MVGEDCDVVTKQMLVEKHISDIMRENPRGTASLSPLKCLRS